MQEQRALADRTRGLEKLLELRERLPLQTAAAEIIGAAATPRLPDADDRQGHARRAAADMAVIAPAGVVGRLVVPSARVGEGAAARSIATPRPAR